VCVRETEGLQIEVQLALSELRLQRQATEVEARRAAQATQAAQAASEREKLELREALTEARQHVERLTTANAVLRANME